MLGVLDVNERAIYRLLVHTKESSLSIRETR
jgi:hypothetical protein